LVSGSSQVSYTGLSSIPSGIVSGSSQITFSGISGIPSGLISGSSQVSIASTTGFGTYINQALLTTSSPSFAGLTSTAAFNITTTSTQPVVISGDTATNSGVLFRIQTAEVNDSFATGKRTFLGDGGADIIIGTANSSYTPGNTYMALNHSGEISMGAGSATKHFTLSTGGNLTISGTIGASNFSGASSGTNTGDVTETLATVTGRGASTSTSTSFTGGLTSYAGVTKFGYTSYASANTSVQVKNSSYSYAHKTYDTLQIVQDDVTTLRLIEYNNGGTNQMIGLTTGDGNSNLVSSQNLNLYVNAGPDSITLYNGGGGTLALAFNTSGVAQFNNTVKGAAYFDAQASSGFRIRNSGDSANVGGWTRRGLWEGNSNYDPALWAETGYGLYFYSNGSANIRAYFDTSGHFVPGANATYNLGSSSSAWANLYTNDLHLSNMGKEEGNEIDGTKGTWTIQEGAENLYIINNNNGKKFKIKLEEI
jgi:hypothetical protein